MASREPCYQRNWKGAVPVAALDNLPFCRISFPCCAIFANHSAWPRIKGTEWGAASELSAIEV